MLLSAPRAARHIELTALSTAPLCPPFPPRFPLSPSSPAQTTGLADPAPVVQTFFVDETIQEMYALDAVITVVDAKEILVRLAEEKPEGVENESVEQVSFADKVLLNKIDLVNEKMLAKVEREVRKLNPTIPILRCLHCESAAAPTAPAGPSFSPGVAGSLIPSLPPLSSALSLTTPPRAAAQPRSRPKSSSTSRPSTSSASSTSSRTSSRRTAITRTMTASPASPAGSRGTSTR